MSSIRLRWALLMTALLFSVGIPAAAEEAKETMDKAWMNAVIRFAETVLEHGRDTYGEKHTPLFTDTLDVDTMKAPDRIYID